MAGKEIDNMNEVEKQMYLSKIIEVIKSGNYDIEKLISSIPSELLPDVLAIFQSEIQNESFEIEEEISSKGRK
ncbi:MAG: hypothetical protein MRZ42_05010 [Tenericutes bacterium]|nr:hypothetical protein [Mycoplasmatota bacterium]